MDFKKIFKDAKKAGITELNIIVKNNNVFKVEILDDKLDKYNGRESSWYSFTGKYNKKLGSYSSENYQESDNDLIIKTMIQNATLKDLDEEVIFPDDKNKVEHIVKEPVVDLSKKMIEVNNYYQELKAYNPLIKKVHILFDYTYNRIRIINSHGLDKEDSIYSYGYYLSVSAQKDDIIKSEYTSYSGINDIDIKDKLYELADEAIKKLSPIEIRADKYKVILSPRTSAKLFSAFIQTFYGGAVQKDNSLFKDKLKEIIASKKLTIIEDPRDKKSAYKRLFDAGGTDTYKKELITNGKLNMFLYNLLTAARGKTESTGNDFKGTGFRNMYIKPLNKTKEELFELVGSGVLVTDVRSLHSGANLTSGNISVQAEGFLIKDGKLAGAIDYFVLNTDFKSLLKNIEEIGSDLEVSGNFRSPSIVISNVDITT